MKNLLVLPVTLLLFCCNAQKSNFQSAELNGDNCPPEGKCTVELLAGKSISVRNSDIGRPYHELVESATTDVVKYEYSRVVKDTTLQDAGYTEVVLFEIDKANPEIKVEGKNLSKTKMIFGRFCFCRGATGIYHVTDGQLEITRKKKELVIDLNFKIHEVPQIVSKLRIDLK